MCEPFNPGASGEGPGSCRRPPMPPWPISAVRVYGPSWAPRANVMGGGDYSPDPGCSTVQTGSTPSLNP